MCVSTGCCAALRSTMCVMSDGHDLSSLIYSALDAFGARHRGASRLAHRHRTSSMLVNSGRRCCYRAATRVMACRLTAVLGYTARAASLLHAACRQPCGAGLHTGVGEPVHEVFTTSRTTVAMKCDKVSTAGPTGGAYFVTTS